MELETLFGLPAHPLIVHGVVVLLPLAAILTIVVAIFPKARRHYAPLALGLALVSVLLTGLAQGSGESLEEKVDETESVEAHTDAGESVLPWAIGLAVVAAAITAAEPLSRKFDKLTPTVVTSTAVALALVTGVGATYTVIDVGHSGAKSVWEDTGSENGESSGSPSEESENDRDDDRYERGEDESGER